MINALKNLGYLAYLNFKFSSGRKGRAKYPSLRKLNHCNCFLQKELKALLKENLKRLKEKSRLIDSVLGIQLAKI